MVRRLPGWLTKVHFIIYLLKSRFTDAVLSLRAGVRGAFIIEEEKYSFLLSKADFELVIITSHSFLQITVP